MPGKLTKAGLAKDIAENCRCSLKEAKQLLELTLGAMVCALSRGEKVEIRGFGSLAVRMQRPRRTRNPRTGEVVSVQARRVAYFRVSKYLSREIQ